MTYTRVSVRKTAKKNAGTPQNKKDQIVIFDWDEVLSGHERDSRGVKIPGSIVMKDNFYMIEIYGTVNTITPGYTMEGDMDTKGFIHGLTFDHPGDEDEILEFIQNNTNRNLGAIVRKCDSNRSKLYGTPCHPLQINATGVDDANKVVQTIALEGQGRTQFVPGTYQGNFTFETALAVIAADDDAPSVADGSGQYQLTNNLAATEITTLEDAVHDGVYTLLGSGGDNPSTISDGNDFALKNGAGWTGNTNAQITFRAFKNGAASFLFIELSRT